MPQTPYRVSLPFKSLLTRFGEVAATMSFYSKARSPGPVDRPGENLVSLADREPGEPAVIIKISGDGEFHMHKAVDEAGAVDENLDIWEFPEDEFWFFEAFRPAISRLSFEVPGYLFEMALINLYAVFEAFVSDLLRERLRRIPRLISAKAHRAAVADRQASHADQLEIAIDIELRRLTYGPIGALLHTLRADLEMTTLPADHDHALQTLALVRNCLLHAGGIVDQRLATADPSFVRGERLQISDDDMSAAMKVIRDVSIAIDRADQFSEIAAASTF